MNPLTLACGPDVVALTLTLTVQELLTGMEAPVGVPNVSVVAPAVGDHVGEPAQVVAAAGVEATSKPEGKVSEKLMPLKATVVFGLARVKVKVEVPLTATGLGEKALVMVGGLGTPQPVNVTLSTYISEPEAVLPELKK